LEKQLKLAGFRERERERESYFYILMIGYLRGVLFIILYLSAGLLEGFFFHCIKYFLHYFVFKNISN
jgi:hypothetical protein